MRPTQPIVGMTAVLRITVVDKPEKASKLNSCEASRSSQRVTEIMQIGMAR